MSDLSELTPHQQVVATIAAAYPTPAWAPPTLLAYAAMVEDLDARALEVAATTWIKTHSERPSIADLRKAVAANQATAASSPYLDPDEAWAHVETSITRVGGYSEFPDTHPLVAETVRAIGWQRLCQSDNTVADRAHFLQLYRARRCRNPGRGAARGDGRAAVGRPPSATADRAARDRSRRAGAGRRGDRVDRPPPAAGAASDARGAPSARDHRPG